MYIGRQSGEYLLAFHICIRIKALNKRGKDAENPHPLR